MTNTNQHLGSTLDSFQAELNKLDKIETVAIANI